MKIFKEIQKELKSDIKEFVLSHPHEDVIGDVIIDGLTDALLYEKSPIKVLFVLKEAYDEKHIGGFDHCDYLRKLNKYSDIPTHKRVSWISTGILRNLINSDNWDDLDFEDYRKDLCSVGWINIGKFPAKKGTTTSSEWLKVCFNYWKQILYKQIKNYDPDIIIFGNTFKLFEEDGFEWIQHADKICEDGRTKFYRDNNNRLFIDTYHPGIPCCVLHEDIYLDIIIKGVRELSFRNKPANYNK